MSTTRRVAINPTVKVHEILTIYDYTASEISAAWYDEEEMDRITQRCFKVLYKYENGKSKNGQRYFIRGLEGHSTLGSISKRNNREAAYTAVLEEQQRQYENEETDVQAISDSYQRTSSSSQMWAQVVGRRDERAAEAYLYDDEEEEEEETTVFLATPPELQSTDSKTLSRDSRIRRKVSSTSPAFSPSARAA
mmetsp:Transcript_45732/g.110833  ORF Transcript_45732/g.110833 Transcript_45732/m.110833 type:complete len:193 (+) Transcript_45732:584-1162(+)|eukprot:CAMPEP_0113624664 /NCGR_PEP_ID=MMETSP0017_2-20120614/12723_1 /TAXON_ID=2856 /ORGANISM="Cylindrotheca closterium" /LENGTH=192 /DNA_ID=CAMNT_0000534719 /DNA_START=189 /DNA_END=767 /DNA_ORIENTATION=- /assembly_acc=CAM_ASM_000147